MLKTVLDFGGIIVVFLTKVCIVQGINLDNRHKDADDLLSVVLTQLESAKPDIELDQDDDKKHCEHFALNVFRKAQRKDESGIADRDTAKAYYAAFNFLEVRASTLQYYDENWLLATYLPSA